MKVYDNGHRKVHHKFHVHVACFTHQWPCSHRCMSKKFVPHLWSTESMCPRCKVIFLKSTKIVRDPITIYIDIVKGRTVWRSLKTCYTDFNSAKVPWGSHVFCSFHTTFDLNESIHKNSLEYSCFLETLRAEAPWSYWNAQSRPRSTTIISISWAESPLTNVSRDALTKWISKAFFNPW